ncbi:TrmH family RNA methyltransferase [Ruminiclostridium cellobioparum]|uniref:rRNA methylase, putative, group 3 n=1 Tax=Ruminiclostridium cellobioparum subsp. termitidis CT1112 TaxID=1195236 RepID=S0FIK4_RUMCE|nr:RNA methyltransferase [Ruminiclostridium cellobioparum]EMS71507.1 rRNA methylase, putative, group 3 [Ruminiclostridium cellobioparum subsp. termitidis CT1112]
MNYIQSSQNSTIKEIKALHQKKHRDSHEMYFVEGIRFVSDAVDNGQVIIKAVISDRLESLNGGELLISKLSEVCSDIYNVPDKLFKEISDTQSPQGVLAVLKKRTAGIGEALRQGKSVVVLDSLQDPGNVGTIIRTADAAGVSAVLMTRGCVDVYSPKVLRSTMGSVFHLPIIEDLDIINTIQLLKSSGYKVIASHLHGQNNYYDEDLTCKSAIIVGNEANGISEETAALSDKLVRIPMPGKAESLNASVAASIMIYELVRQNRA